MFRNIRRKSQALSSQACIEILTKAEYGSLATIGKDNHPYVVPVNHVYHDQKIIFHCANQGHKLDNIRFNPNVSFNVVTDVAVAPNLSLDKESKKMRFKGFKREFSKFCVMG